MFSGWTIQPERQDKKFLPHMISNDILNVKTQSRRFQSAQHGKKKTRQKSVTHTYIFPVS